MSLDESVDLIFHALIEANAGETYVPLVPSANIQDLAIEIIGDQKNSIIETGIRPGEKLHEILISEEEARRSVKRLKHLVILPMLPELLNLPVDGDVPFDQEEYSSENDTLTRKEIGKLLLKKGLRYQDNLLSESELIR